MKEPSIHFRKGIEAGIHGLLEESDQCFAQGHNQGDGECSAELAICYREGQVSPAISMSSIDLPGSNSSSFARQLALSWKNITVSCWIRTPGIRKPNVLLKSVTTFLLKTPR